MCSCSDLRARLEIAIEHVLELVRQVERQKADDRRSSVSDEVWHGTITASTATVFSVFNWFCFSIVTPDQARCLIDLSLEIFYASAHRSVAGDIMVLSFPSMHPCVHPKTLLTWYLADYLTHFYQTCISDALWDRDGCFTVWVRRSRSQWNKVCWKQHFLNTMSWIVLVGFSPNLH